MPKVVYVEELGQIGLYKKRGNKNIRLSFDSSGQIRVSLPAWTPYEVGIKFALTRKSWIEKHRPASLPVLKNGSRIGKAHSLQFIAKANLKSPRVKIANNLISVSTPTDLAFNHSAVQAAANRGSRLALEKEAGSLLPQRLKQLAEANAFAYKSLRIKQLKSKWGSCNQFKEITLNYYLMQLPWQLIDYVLLHELVHTEHLNHGPEFWRRFQSIMPNAKLTRKELKDYKTTVVSGPAFTVD